MKIGLNGRRGGHFGDEREINLVAAKRFKLLPWHHLDRIYGEPMLRSTAGPSGSDWKL